MSVNLSMVTVTKEAEILQEGFSLIFCRVKLLPDSNILVALPVLRLVTVSSFGALFCFSPLLRGLSLAISSRNCDKKRCC